MNGQHVLIDDSTGIMTTGPLKGQKHKASSKAENKKKHAVGAALRKSSAPDDFDKGENIVSNVGETNDKQKVIGKVTPNKNLRRIETPAGPHQVAEGTDISETVEIKPNTVFSAFEQIAYQQGFKNPPQIITDAATFDIMVAQSDFIGIRSVNTYKDRDGKTVTGVECIETFKNYDADEIVSNTGGGSGHGLGLYFFSNVSLKGVHANQHTMEVAKNKATDHLKTALKGSAQYKITLQPGTKIITEEAARGAFESANQSIQSKYYQMCTNVKHPRNVVWSLYAVARGYDAVQDTINKTTMVYNLSKLVIFDENVTEI